MLYDLADHGVNLVLVLLFHPVCDVPLSIVLHGHWPIVLGLFHSSQCENNLDLIEEEEHGIWKCCPMVGHEVEVNVVWLH